MTALHDDLIINELGQIVNDDSNSSDNFQNEDGATSIRELEDQGISIIDGKNDDPSQNQDSFTSVKISRDFFKEEGIELLDEEEDSFL